MTFANIVSMLALFIALGGISWAAAKLPKNSVGTKQLKKSAVNNSDIKKNAVTGSKVKSDTLTGSDIKESTLAQVPSAAAAGTAATATQAESQINVIKRVDSSASAGSQAAARAAAAEVPLASNGLVDVYAKCYSSAGDVFAETFARSSQNGAIVTSFTGPAQYVGTPSYLDAGTTEDLRFTAVVSTSANTSTTFPSVFPVTLIGPDGRGLAAKHELFVRNGNPPGGGGPFTSASSCIFVAHGAKINS